MTITITDGTTSMEWVGVWATKPRAGSNEAPFQVDKERLSVREVFILAERGLTHVYGSEAAAKWNQANKAGKAEIEDKARMKLEAQEEYREAMYADTWASGTRISRAAPEDRLTTLFKMEVNKEVKRLINAQLRKGEKDTEGNDTWLDTEGNAFPLRDWVDNYLGNDDDDGNGRKLGDVRREVHMAEATAKFAEEQRQAASRAETRKIIGTKI